MELEPEVGPNQLKHAVKTLTVIDELSRAVSRPFTSAQVNYAAKSLLGLLLMYLVAPGLQMDFRAFMTLGGVTREGAFDAEHNRLPDPDRVKRKVLRDTFLRLKRADLLKVGKIVYGDLRSATDGPLCILEHVPDEGIVCWGVIYVRNRPRGERTRVFTLKMPEVKLLNWTTLEKLLAEPAPSRIEATRESTRLSCDLLAGLFSKNKITETAIMSRLERLSGGLSSVELGRMAYFLCAVERQTNVVQRLKAVFQLLDCVEM